MKCKKCSAEVPDGSRYCLNCGAKLVSERRTKSRGNGQGSVFKRENSSWTACVTLGYTITADGRKHRQTREKSGFSSKKEAVAYLPKLMYAQTAPKKAITMQQLYAKWEPTHRAGKSTMECYRAAWNYFSSLYCMQVHDVDIDDLQECMDACPKGKRTRENMKALCGLLYKYAIPRNLAAVNLGQYLVVGGGEAADKSALPMEAVEKLQKVINSVPYADYIVAQCYLGFRPSELLALDVIDYDRKQRAFIGGAKTEAGRNRTVTVSPRIQPIIDRLVQDKIAGPVFCAPNGGQMTIKAYREVFYAALEKAGIDNPIIERGGVNRRTYTPHSCRHTFATMMKSVQAPDKDKLELIGHTSTEMLRHYQSVDIEALRKITDAM